MDRSELEVREQRAQEGVLSFAQEMTAIREGNLYPGAYKAGAKAWPTYCSERWGLGERQVDTIIQAAPVIARQTSGGAAGLTVTVAATVATLPVEVQDALLRDSRKREVVKARAKAARAVIRKAKRKGVAADVEKVIAAAMAAKPAKRRKNPAPMAPKDDLLPKIDDPRDHGCKPRRLKRDAVHANWRAYEALKDVALDDDDVQAMQGMVERDRRLLDLIESVLSGEGIVTDEALADLLAGRA